MVTVIRVHFTRPLVTRVCTHLTVPTVHDVCTAGDISQVTNEQMQVQWSREIADWSHSRIRTKWWVWSMTLDCLSLSWNKKVPAVERKRVNASTPFTQTQLTPSVEMSADCFCEICIYHSHFLTVTSSTLSRWERLSRVYRGRGRGRDVFEWFITFIWCFHKKLSLLSHLVSWIIIHVYQWGRPVSLCAPMWYLYGYLRLIFRVILLYTGTYAQQVPVVHHHRQLHPPLSTGTGEARALEPPLEAVKQDDRFILSPTAIHTFSSGSLRWPPEWSVA